MMFLYLACIWQGRDCKLLLHYEDGLTLLSNSPSDNVKLNGPTMGMGHVYWHYPYENIRATGDDGNRIFWVDVGGDVGEQVFYM